MNRRNVPKYSISGTTLSGGTTQNIGLGANGSKYSIEPPTYVGRNVRQTSNDVTTFGGSQFIGLAQANKFSGLEHANTLTIAGRSIPLPPNMISMRTDARGSQIIETSDGGQMIVDATGDILYDSTQVSQSTSAPSHARSGRTYVKETFDIRGAQRLSFETRSASIHVSANASNLDTMTIYANYRYTNNAEDAVSIQSSLTGTSLTPNVVIDPSMRNFITLEHVTINVPVHLNLDLVSASGTISLDGEGASIRAKTMSGDIEAQLENGSPINAKTMSGTLDINGTAPGSIEARSVSGRITIAVNNPRRINATSVSGTVDLRFLSPYTGTVSAKSVSGYVDVPQYLQSRRGQADINLSSVSGVVSVRQR